MRIIGTSRERGWGLFPNGWVGDVLLLLIETWDSFCLPADVRLEPRITKLFANAIYARYEAEDRDWFVTVEQPDWDPAGKETTRTDLRFYPPGRKRRKVCLVFETKRLNTPKSNVSEYVGTDGMMCFVTGKYSPGLPYCGMLGYVMDGNVARAHATICRAVLDHRDELRLQADGDYRPMTLLPGHKWHGETKHQLAHGTLIICHLLLEVRRNAK
jgi:hypothetical protein